MDARTIGPRIGQVDRVLDFAHARAPPALAARQRHCTILLSRPDAMVRALKGTHEQELDLILSANEQMLRP